MAENVTTITTIVKTVVEVFEDPSDKMSHRNSENRAQNIITQAPRQTTLTQAASPQYPHSPHPQIPSSPVEALEISDLKVSFREMEDVLMRSDAALYDEVNAVAVKVAEIPQIASALAGYINTVVRTGASEDKSASSGSTATPKFLEDQLLVNLMNKVLLEAPGCGLRRPYVHGMSYSIQKRHRVGDSVESTVSDDEVDFGGISSICVGSVTNNGPTIDWRSVGVVIEIDQQRGKTADMSVASSSDNSSSIKHRRSGSRNVTPSLLSHSLTPIGTKRPSLGRAPLPSPMARASQSRGSSEHFSSSIAQHSSNDPSNSKLPSHIPSTPLSRKGKLLAQGVLEVLSALGNRRHAIGLLVEGTEIQLRYYDRAGCISSSDVLDLNSEADAIRFIAIIINISLSTIACLGVEPAIVSQFDTISSSISGSRVLVDGRGFELDSVLHTAHSLNGRGTVVYKARPLPIDGVQPSDTSRDVNVDLPDLVVVKLSWQVTTQESEERLFRIAAQHGLQGIATLYHSSVAGRLSTGCRGRLLPLRSEEYVDRELRIQVMGPMCVPLYTVQKLSKFKKAFKSLVQS